MIQCDHLTKSYGAEKLLDDVSFSIGSRERCGFVGRNGSGKTTLFRLITGQEESDAGRVAIPDYYRLGYLGQHLHFTQSTLLEEAILGLPEEERDNVYKVETLLFGLGFTKADMGRALHEFSGGYHLRLQLVKVLASEPDCLLLDEPTNYLDILSIRWLERFLRSWPGEMILISHDRTFLDSVTTHILGIHRQKVRKVRGKTEDFFSQILREEEIHEKTRINLDKKRAHAQAFIERFGAKATKAAQAQSRQKTLDKLPVLAQLAELWDLDFCFRPAPFHGQKMLEAKQISFSYKPEVPLIRNFSLTIEKGQRIAIIGKNGQGKSTLLKLLSQNLKPVQGSLQVSEALRIGYFGQTNIDALDPTRMIEEEISHANPLLNNTQVRAICGVMLFSGDKARKRISVLSGGEKSRVLLGKILATPCNLLFLDEPTSHLDMESIEALIEAVEDFEGSVVIVTHSEEVLRRLPLTQLLVCHKGRQELFLGGYNDFLTTRGWEEESEEEEEELVVETESEAYREKAKERVRLEKQIATLEEQIVKVERELEKQDQLLILASEQSDLNKVQELTKRRVEKKKELDHFFEKLEKLLESYET